RFDFYFLNMMNSGLSALSPHSEEGLGSSPRLGNQGSLSCVVFACSPCVCMGFLQVLRFPPSVHRHAVGLKLQSLKHAGGFTCVFEGPLQDDKVALTSAGKLQCDFIIHMVGPHSTAEARLRVKKVLEQCEKKKISTVSFPAIGTGRGGLSGEEAMIAILEAFEDHLFQRSFTAVKLVYVVVDHDEVLQELLQVLKDPAKQPLCLTTALAAVSFTVMTVEVYGTSPAGLAIVKKLLDDLISEECTSRDVQSSYLANLQEADREAIVTLSKNNQVRILVSSSDKLTVSGKKEDVLDTVLNISSFIQTAKEREARESEMKRLSETLCWEVAEEEEWVPLDSSISYQLELAFHKKEQNFTYNEKGEVYTVDLKELTKRNSRGKSCRIRRTLIGDSDTGKNLNESCKPALIHRIQNKGQWQRYSVLKQEVDKKYPEQINEQFLYHGTTKEICQKINNNGFNRSFCGRNAVAHGHGTYFALEAWYSCQHKFSSPDENGLKYVYRARVVTGMYCRSRRGMKEPDPLDPNDPQAGLFDCAVDDLEDPFIFVVFCDAGAYPDYLIIFKNI
uniref:Poly [ADP-ribose] polymerase n=1 Tax=Pygocentrus nattereri TaxID=42514 RepID=A0A3B4ENF2_PYGNA